ncbi:MAG: hypothetical protein JNK37_03575 [Verrucomicrobiales bacterium]|nr:hypothetical protein [Verrucomicrobiales bacterium]
MKIPSLSLFLIALAALSASARDFRDFTNLEGKTIHAELLDLRGEQVRIRMQNGRVFDVPVASLSEADRAYLKEWDAKRRGAEEELYYSETIFADDFSGEGFGERWGHYKSQSVIQDGVLIGKTIDIKDHAGVDSIRFEGRQDMEVSVKFKFAGPEAERFNVWFDDKDYKGSHAGHIASITITPTGGNITEAKTGNMENAIYEKKNAPGGLDEETKKLLESKTAKFDLELDRDEWHTLLIRTKGPVITVLVDGKEAGELESEGNAHPTKSLVSLTTTINDVHYDDFSVKAAPPGKAEPSAE